MFGKIKKDLQERKALPIGRTELNEFCERIIAQASVEANKDDQKFALCSMLVELGPTEAFKEDAYFALRLRKAAVNQTAGTIMQEMRDAKRTEQLAKKQEEEKQKLDSERVASSGPTLHVLEDKKV